MFGYYTPLRSESPDGIFTFPFLIGASAKNGKLVLLKGFADSPHNPVVMSFGSEQKNPDGTITIQVETGLGNTIPVTFTELTADYVLANKSLYPFTAEQLASIHLPGMLSIFAQATIPAWYDSQYPAPDAGVREAALRDFNGTLYEQQADGSWEKAK
jgi:hypothetical protein